MIALVSLKVVGEQRELAVHLIDAPKICPLALLAISIEIYARNQRRSCIQGN